jgi:ribosomal protein L40E
MPRFIDRLKEGAEKAGFEADRLRRLNQAQSSLRTMQREMESKTEDLGRQTLTLYDGGYLTQPELLNSCRAEVDRLRRQIADQEALIERIRHERTPEAEISALYGHICPSCQIQLPAGTDFCPRCGSKAVDVVSWAESTRKCRFCGTPVPPGARFSNSQYGKCGIIRGDGCRKRE